MNRNSQSLSVLSPPESQSDQSGSREIGGNVVQRHLSEVEKALCLEGSHVNEQKIAELQCNKESLNLEQVVELAVREFVQRKKKSAEVSVTEKPQADEK